MLFSQLCAYSCSAGFIHHQTSACNSEKNHLSHPAPCPSAQAGSSGSISRWLRKLRIIAAAYCLSACSKPSSNPAVHSVGKMICARLCEAGGNFLYPSLSSRTMYSLTISLAILLSSRFLASVIS